MFDAGLGIRSADSHASAAFLSSSFEYESIVSRPLDDPSPDIPDVDGALQHLSGVLCLDEPIIEGGRSWSQTAWSEPENR